MTNWGHNMKMIDKAETLLTSAETALRYSEPQTAHALACNARYVLSEVPMIPCVTRLLVRATNVCNAIKLNKTA